MSSLDNPYKAPEATGASTVTATLPALSFGATVVTTVFAIASAVTTFFVTGYMLLLLSLGFVGSVYYPFTIALVVLCPILVAYCVARTTVRAFRRTFASL